jgi:hypothetical protein
MQKRAKKSNTFTDKTDAECEVAKLRKAINGKGMYS